MDVDITNDELSKFLCPSNEALELKLVKNASDIEDEEVGFNPDMSHQVFGEQEMIFGYRDLRVKLYYSASKLTTYLGTSYTEKIKPAEYDGVEADSIQKQLADKLAPGYYTNIDDFTAALLKDSNFKPYGKLVHSFTADKVAENGNSMSKSYEVYTCDMTCSGFKLYHQRLQTFLLWFVDAASFIDADDENWKFFLVYEKSEVGGETVYYVSGYATVYQYYAYPAHKRPRISQVLVLPPYQRSGVGAQLLETIYKEFIANNEVRDITVEDPSDEFIRLRDYVDTKNCRGLPAFAADKLEKGFSADMVKEATEKYKINKRQCRRIYEILKLYNINTNDSGQYRKYRLEVKNRLNIPFQKNKSDYRKLQKTLESKELEAVMDSCSPEQRMEELDKMYQQLEEEYRHTLDRVVNQ